MTKRTITIEILRRTFVSGELAEPGDIFTVSEQDANYLINVKKAKRATPAAGKAATKKKGTIKPPSGD